MSEKKKNNNDYIYAAYADLIPDPQDGTYDHKKEKNKTQLSRKVKKNDSQSKKRN